MKRILVFNVILIVAGLIAGMVTAKASGLDRQHAWDNGRVLLLSGGLVAIAVAGYAQRRDRTTAADLPRFLGGLHAWDAKQAFRFVFARRLGIFVTLSVLAAVAIYAFFGSTGTWTHWPETSRYYDDLATAFRAGRLDLNIQPPGALMAMPDPYDTHIRNTIPGLRAFVDTVWDISFYHGRFYPYWGPAPALVLAFIKFFYGGTLADQYLALGFLVGLLIFNTLLILRFRYAFQEPVPLSLVVLAVAVSALAYPIPWMLSHAAIYEVSIGAGQCFLIGGVYVAYRALEEDIVSASGLLLAAALWTLAVASRLVMILPVALMMGTTCLWSIEHNRSAKGTRDIPRTLFALGGPLSIGLLVLGWYNRARFGSVFETGVRYMLTSIDLHRFYSGIFMGQYAASNLRLYLAGPMIVKRSFPFVAPKPIPAFALMGIHHVEQITGLLYAVPFVLLSLVSLVQVKRWAARFFTRDSGDSGDKDGSMLSWVTISLAGASLLAFTALLPYFYVAIRFLADVLPSLILLSVLGMWKGYVYVRDRLILRRFYVLAVIALGLLSIVISLLLTMAESYPQFEYHNPLLMRQILLLFAHR